MYFIKVEKTCRKIKIKLLGIKLSVALPKLLNPFKKPVFRNDDVSVDSNLQYFKKFCEVFHTYGFTQLHAVNLYGYTNCNFITNGVPSPYDGYANLGSLDNATIRKLSAGKFIGDNKELVKYLNDIPDKIALHGLYHTDYSKMTYAQQKKDIQKGLDLLNALFPLKKIDTFVAPFNRTNDDTYRVCRELGLKVSALEGEHLEDMIEHRRYGIKNGEIYRYHHHRFYPESKFRCYNLSIERLNKFLGHKKVWKRHLPDQTIFTEIIHEHHLSEWFVQAFTQFTKRLYTYLPYKWILDHITKKNTILVAGCGAGDMLYHLYEHGYKYLFGYDFDNNVIHAAQEIADRIDAPINFFITSGHHPNLQKTFDVIIAGNRICHVSDYGAENFIKAHIPYLKRNGFLIFDTIDAAFNQQDNNNDGILDQDSPLSQNKTGEYPYKYSLDDIKELAEKYHFDVIYHEYLGPSAPHHFYILKRKKLPKICLLCDKPNWAHDHSAQEIRKQLSDNFIFDIKYVVDKPKLNPKHYDLLHVFFWGEDYYKKFGWPKAKILKQVSSHRWQDNPKWGPCSPAEFQIKYLSDAEYVNCPSQILYNLLKNVCPNLFFVGKGYSPDKFYYKNLRKGEMTICFAGNIKDPVKGIDEILIPAAKDKYILNLASSFNHTELLNFYNAHDIYVVSSRNEADPLPLIESMACGCFPVANQVGIAPELIRHKENGYLVTERTVAAYQEAFAWCHEHLDYIRSQQEKIAQEIYDSRRWEIMAGGYKNMYQKCLSK